jgi:Zn-dependent M28 family amino/carboxypeptidase
MLLSLAVSPSAVSSVLALTVMFGSSSVALAAGPLEPATIQSAPPIAVDSARLMRDVEVLAADGMEGRRTGTPAGARARAYVIQRFKEVKLPPLGDGYEQPFKFATQDELPPRVGTNVLGVIRGTARPERIIVVTAHYDHIGVRRDGQVYNGADDNASGTAALFAVADHFVKNPPPTTLVIAALDGEEMGLRGARALLNSPALKRDSIVMNVNIDMIGRDPDNVLYAAGTHHYPQLKPMLQNVSHPPVELRLGKDVPGKDEDWTRSSDHAEFHRVGIPFVYFGEENAAHHHKVTDDPSTIQPEFFTASVKTIISAVTRFASELK